MKLRPYIGHGRHQFVIGVRYLPAGAPAWGWKYRFIGFVNQVFYR